MHTMTENSPNDNSSNDNSNSLVAKAEPTYYALKRPGLFAVKAILENAGSGWGKYSDLVETTNGVRNRRDFAAYIRLLEKLGWIKLNKLTVPTKGSRWRSFRFYEMTEKGKVFLDLFPKDEKAEENPL